MSVEFDFSEVDRLATDFSTAATKIVPETESKVLSPAARQVRAAASAAAPRLTGALAGSVYIRDGKGSRTVGSDLKQGFFQEFGTSRHPPQPWLFAAGDKGGDEMAKLFEQIADPLI